MKHSLLVGSLFACIALFTACPPAARCSPDTCAGCCDAEGVCQPGDSAAACGQGGGTCQACGTGESCQARVCTAADGGTPDGGHGSVLGSQRLFHVTDGTTAIETPDLSGMEIAALVPSGAGSPFTSSFGSGTSAGTFTIPNVPEGPYYLKYGAREFVVTSKRTVDLSFHLFGRTEALLAVAPTPVTFELTNLAPWQATDDLQFVSVGAATTLYRFEEAPSIGTPDAGDTSASITVDWAEHQGNLVVSGLGDIAYITQLETRDAGGVAYQGVGRALIASAMSMEDGKPTTVSGALSPAPEQTLQVSWKRSAFDGHRADVSPSGVFEDHYLYIDAQPGGLENGFFGPTPDLAIVNTPGASGSSDLELTLSFGNPFPSSWPLVALAVERVKVPITAPGATTSLDIYGTIASTVAVTGSTLTVTPTLSPPREIQINGQSAFSPRTGVGFTPLLSWNPPALGTPDSYRVSVYQVLNGNGETVRVFTARITTTDTQVRIPPNLLVPNATFFALVSAQLRAGIDPEAAPFRLALPAAHATAVTSTFTP